jgi:hypothetical protein
MPELSRLPGDVRSLQQLAAAGLREPTGAV